MNAEREVKVDYPEAHPHAYDSIQGKRCFAIVSDRTADAKWIGTGLTERSAWDDAYRSICFAAFAERNQREGEPTS